MGSVINPNPCVLPGSVASMIKAAITTFTQLSFPTSFSLDMEEAIGQLPPINATFFTRADMGFKPHGSPSGTMTHAGPSCRVRKPDEHIWQQTKRVRIVIAALAARIRADRA